MQNLLLNVRHWVDQVQRVGACTPSGKGCSTFSHWVGVTALTVGSTGWAQTHSAYDASQAHTVVYTEMAYGLQHPWALAFLPNGDFLVAEQEGTMRIVDAHGRVGTPLAGLPAVAYVGQGGLLDVALDRDFATNRRLYFCYAQPDASGGGNRSTTALASAVLNERQDRLEQVQTVFHQSPSVRSTQHFGCRIAQAQDGSLFLTLGDRFIARDQAQRTTNHLGSIVRLQVDGRAYADNPLMHQRTGLPETWSWGHRNPLGAVITPDGELWTHEAGPQGGDELNHIRGGANYGWPLVSYDSNNQGRKARAEMEPPVHYWSSEIQPSGLAFLNGDQYGPAWQGSFFIGSLTYGAVVRMKVVDDKVQEEEWLQVVPGASVRDVRQGPDGLLYVLTDGADGRLLRLEPPEQPAAQAVDPALDKAGTAVSDALAPVLDAVRTDPAALGVPQPVPSTPNEGGATTDPWTPLEPRVDGKEPAHTFGTH